ncbi:circadian clock protein KaiC [Arcticibacter eurypsychrophilus]|uniref:circadian clock protein KaiC n=1 Tax=Arcticibacter eurypsychrophilus TaxID=1434752 RepID=UPI00084DB211|nr:circadian clock protein KaiC [Arcticibacter eurypsychrophilus]
MDFNEKNKLNLGLLPKTPTGILGLDDITGGGLPKGRPTLICGGTGSGKTLMSLEFIVNGATKYDEPGVFMAFEEKAEELIMNVASLGFDLAALVESKKVSLDYVYIDPNAIEETGQYDLEGVFIRLGYAIDQIGAKRVVLDTVENLFSDLTNETTIRAELRRLFQWLKEKGVTAIITGEKGDKLLTRRGLEEYVSDCVIFLDHRIINKISTRLLRIVKYRGSTHGTNEYPFLIDSDGISVLPITSLNMDNVASSERISTGITGLDSMLGGQGFFRGSSILISGTAGTGKTNIAATFASSICDKGEKCIYFSFEESANQLIRNMTSIGLDLQKHIDADLLEIITSRPTMFGLEMHLVDMHKKISEIKPKAVIIDPITNLVTVGSVNDVKAMLIRLIDFLQKEQITVLFTALTINNSVTEQTYEVISSLVDAWLLVRDIEFNGERNRGVCVMKSRGMKHSNQIREFIITDDGLDLVEVYLGSDGVLTGSAREAQILKELTGDVLKGYQKTRKDREISRKKQILDATILTLKAKFESAEEELNRTYTEELLTRDIQEKNRKEITHIRGSSPKKNNEDNEPNIET